MHVIQGKLPPTLLLETEPYLMCWRLCDKQTITLKHKRKMYHVRIDATHPANIHLRYYLL